MSGLNIEAAIENIQINILNMIYEQDSIFLLTFDRSVFT